MARNLEHLPDRSSKSFWTPKELHPIGVRHLVTKPALKSRPMKI